MNHPPQERLAGSRFLWLCDGGTILFALVTLATFLQLTSAYVLGLRLLIIGICYSLFLAYCVYRGIRLENWRFLYWFFSLSTIALGIRLILVAIAPGHWGDLGTNQGWARTATFQGITTSYTHPLAGGTPNYPPLTLMIFAAVGHVFRLIISPDFDAATHTFRIFLRLPGIGADLITALLLAALIWKTSSRRAALLAVVIYLVQPAILHDTVIWGQTDSLHTLLLIVSLTALFFRQWLIAGAAFALALLCKVQAIVFLPIFLLFLRDRRSIAHVTLGFLLASYFVVLPFAQDHSIYEVTRVYTHSVGYYSLLSMNAYNLWWVLFGESAMKMLDTNMLIGSLSYRWVAFWLLGLTVCVILWLLRRPLSHPPDSSGFLRACSLAASLIVAAFFLLNTEMHERYLFPFVALGLPFAFSGLVPAALYGGVSLLFFLNLTGAFHFTAADRWLFSTFPAISRAIGFMQLFLFSCLLEYARKLGYRSKSALNVTPSFVRFLLPLWHVSQSLWSRCWKTLCHPHTIFWMLIVVGIFVRGYQFGAIPPGLNQDEGSLAYDAYSLLHYGVERHGFHFPVMLPSFGNGQSGTLAAYLSMPFIGALGLNVFSARALNFVCSILSFFVFYFFVKKVSDRPTALIGLFILVTNPWNIMMARWGLDCNLFPPFLLLGTYFLTLSVTRRWFLPLAFLVFGLSLYTYAVAYLVVPLFLIGACVYMAWYRKLPAWPLLSGLTLFLCISIPLVLFLVVNQWDLPSMRLGPLTVNHLITGARYKEATSLFGSLLIKDIVSNGKILWNLLAYQNDGMLWNVLPAYGYMYLFNALFLLLGIGVLLRKTFVSIYSALSLILFWLIAAVILGLVMFHTNINRVNCIIFPLLVCLSLGIASLRQWKIVLLFVLLANGIGFLSFTRTYFTTYPEKIGPQFFESLDDAISFASNATPGPVCITRKNTRQPEVMVLFSQKMDPRIYTETVRYGKTEFSNLQPLSFDRYTFGVENCKNSSFRTFVISNAERKDFPPAQYTVRSFKNYSVAVKR